MLYNNNNSSGEVDIHSERMIRTERGREREVKGEEEERGSAGKDHIVYLDVSCGYSNHGGQNND